jgi:hypothetical protein
MLIGTFENPSVALVTSALGRYGNSTVRTAALFGREKFKESLQVAVEVCVWGRIIDRSVHGFPFETLAAIQWIGSPKISKSLEFSLLAKCADTPWKLTINNSTIARTNKKHKLNKKWRDCTSPLCQMARPADLARCTAQSKV